MTASFQFLEEIALADCAFQAQGKNPSELFQAAAQAVMETMANPQSIGTTWIQKIEREEETLEALLFDWLHELVYLKDAEGVLFHDNTVEVTNDHSSEIWKLQGQLRGEPIDHSKQEVRADVKGGDQTSL